MNTSRSLIVVALFLVAPCWLVVAGCGQQAPYETADLASDSYASAESGKADADGAGNFKNGVDATRKIIYNADIILSVKDFDDVQDRITELVRASGGYIANSRIDGQSNSYRTGRWTLRLPVSDFGKFVDDVQELGDLQSLNQDSQEVTSEYYDLAARIRTRQAEEERMLAHLKEDTRSLEDTLTVEKELIRIRGELERLQGQMKLMDNKVDLATLTLTIHQTDKFTPVEPPTFVAKVSTVWFDSIASLVSLLQVLVLTIVACTPWALTLALPMSLVLLIVRRVLIQR